LSWTAKYRGGVHKERGMRGEKRQELGRHCAERSVQRPGSSWTPEANGASTQEIRRECLAAQITSKKSLPLLGQQSAARWLISAPRSPIWALLATTGHRWRRS